MPKSPVTTFAPICQKPSTEAVSRRDALTLKACAIAIRIAHHVKHLVQLPGTDKVFQQALTGGALR